MAQFTSLEVVGFRLPPTAAAPEPAGRCRMVVEQSPDPLQRILIPHSDSNDTLKFQST